MSFRVRAVITPQGPLAAHQEIGHVVAHHPLAGADTGGDQLAAGQDRLDGREYSRGWVPYLTQAGPPASVAALPPMVLRSIPAGSGG